MENEEAIKERKEKVKSWLKDKHNLAFLGIMLFAIAIRFYYFWVTKSQPLWWDEAEYMSAAQAFAGQGYSAISGFRLPFFPMLMSLFFFTGLSYEPLMRFIGLYIPSLIIIFLTYLILSKMYSKKAGLISAIIITVLWEHIFYSNRFHTENLSLIFEFLAIYLIFNLWQNGKFWSKSKIALQVIYILVSAGLCVLARPGNLIALPAFVVFILLYWLFASSLSDKNKNLILLFLFIIGPIIFWLSIPVLFKIPFLTFYYHLQDPINFSSLTVFQGYYLNSFPAIILFFAFLLGLIISGFNIFLSYGQFKKFFLEKKEISSDILNILLILSVLFSMIFLLRVNGFEYRWFFALLPGMLAFTSRGILATADFIKGFFKIKYLAVGIVILILLLGCYPQISHTTALVKNKVSSYEQVKDSGLWIKENSNPEDIVISASLTQHSYYTQRKVIDFYVNGTNDNETAFEQKVRDFKPRYMVISLFESSFTPQGAYTYAERHNGSLTPVKVYAIQTAQGPQTALIVYEFN